VIVRSGGEIGIKSKPVRREYENLLLKLIRGALNDDGVPFSKIWRTAGRIFIRTADADKAAITASKVFGVSSTSPGILAGSDLATIIKTGTEMAEIILKPGTFAVRCRRTGKHTYSSQGVASLMGESILNRIKKMKVDLTSPEQEINVEIRDEMAIIFVKTYRGPDGYPIGTQDTAAGMLDETVDSLVSAWCIMKRGSAIVPIILERPKEIMDTIWKNLAALSEWLPHRGLKCVITTPPAQLVQDATSLRSLHFQLTAYFASKNGIGGMASGIPVDEFKTITSLASRFPVCLLFPLIAMDRNLLACWTNVIGVSLDSLPRYKEALCQYPFFSDSQLSELLASAKEITVSRGQIGLAL